MTRDEIYDHLARVYLGKRQEADLQGKRRWNAWLLNNILITVIIFAGAFYGLAIYVVNLYGFTLLFPWFAMTRENRAASVLTR